MMGETNFGFRLFLTITLFLLIFSGALATTTELTKNGNQFSSTSGSYATSTHCTSTTCSWVVGNQVIVGVYDPNPTTWGGTVEYNFDTSSLANITSASVVVNWPNSTGKGLHSTTTTGVGTISVGTFDNTIALLPMTSNKCGPDYYAHACTTYSVSYPVPLSSISSNTKIIITTNSNTAWDVSEVKLILTTGSTTGTYVQNGKVMINGNQFMIKGVDYAPWISGTGPSPGQGTFPSEFADVTNLVTASSSRSVPDYSANGKIETWEVLKYDVIVMKQLGANTIRTYATGEWHDKDLDGVRESNEIVQGDLPDWAIKRILDEAAANNMKVIVGYWVQEEDYAQSPLVTNYSDLAVAKQAFGRIVNTYKGHSAVLGWGIGNEVQLPSNYSWFTWGVPIKDYLNQLNTYVKGLDSTHPIIYAKYVGEDATFSNINADIIAINAFTNSAQDLINKGMFTTPAPVGRAYMLGEYGHVITQTEGQWNLSQQYAGGAFLEYSDVWWKQSPNFFGVVNDKRIVNTSRYTTLANLYSGTSKCSTNTTCGTNTYLGTASCSTNNVMQNYKSYSCTNAGTIASQCVESSALVVKQTCSASETCSNGACVPVATCGEKADIATYVPSEGKWALLQTKAGQKIQNWGWSYANPVQADYDGDGKTDIATIDVSPIALVNVNTTKGTAWDVSTITLTLTTSTSKTPIVLTKNGNDFASGTGSYATSTHCTSTTCSWVYGSSVIIGVYNADATNWGGSVTYNFSLVGIDTSKITGATVKINWPTTSGKGLHSIYTSGAGSVIVNGSVVGNTPVTSTKCGNNDYYATDCFAGVLSYGVPVSAVAQTVKGEWNILQSSNGAGIKKNLNLFGQIKTVQGDYDGDKKVDVAIYQQPLGKWTIFQSSTNTIVTKSWGWSGANPIPADYDGDKKTDIATYDPVAATWFINFSSGIKPAWFTALASGSSSKTMCGTNPNCVQFGWSEAKPILADFDGDGSTDIANYHPATGTWNIFQTSSRTLKTKQWGWSEALPVPIDYDGDKKADIATYHPGTGTWNIIQSSTGAGKTIQWGWSQAQPVPGYFDKDC